jgi:hypothetical protein
MGLLLIFQRRVAFRSAADDAGSRNVTNFSDRQAIGLTACLKGSGAARAPPRKLSSKTRREVKQKLYLLSMRVSRRKDSLRRRAAG